MFFCLFFLNRHDDQFNAMSAVSANTVSAGGTAIMPVFQHQRSGQFPGISFSLQNDGPH